MRFPTGQCPLSGGRIRYVRACPRTSFLAQAKGNVGRIWGKVKWRSEVGGRKSEVGGQKSEVWVMAWSRWEGVYAVVGFSGSKSNFLLFIFLAVFLSEQ